MRSSEAKKLSEEAVSPEQGRVAEIRGGIDTLIDQAARKGETTITVDSIGTRFTPNGMVQAVVKSLQDDGFTVKRYSDFFGDGAYYLISW